MHASRNRIKTSVFDLPHTREPDVWDSADLGIFKCEIPVLVWKIGHYSDNANGFADKRQLSYEFVHGKMVIVEFRMVSSDRTRRNRRGPTKRAERTQPARFPAKNIFDLRKRYSFLLFSFRNRHVARVTLLLRSNLWYFNAHSEKPSKNYKKKKKFLIDSVVLR